MRVLTLIAAAVVALVSLTTFATAGGAAGGVMARSLPPAVQWPG